MKILKIKSLNINSLKGKFEIDFTTFLEDNSLFAITGPTGAGKSTLLDIITCALYGRTPRLKNPNELMARHTGESLCEVEFEIKGKTYRSLWSLKRAYKKADGIFQSAKMELSDVKTSKVIKSTLRDVPKYVEELCGLDFDKFIQSMMLAQGSFDAFLKAKESQRSLLLEKITGTQIYAKISKEIYDTYSASKTTIDTDSKLLEAIELLDSKEFEEKKKDLEQNKKKKQEYDKKEKELLEIKTWLQTLTKLESEYSKYNELFSAISKEKEEKKEEFLKLELANKALNVETLYEKQNTLEEDIQKDQKTHEQLVSDAVKLKLELSTLKQEYEQSQEKTIKAKESFESETQKIKDVRTLQTQIDEKQKNLDKLDIQISTKIQKQSELQNTQKSIKEEYIKTQELLKTTQEYLSKNIVDETLLESLPLIAKNMKELESQTITLKELQLDKEKIEEQKQKTIYEEKNKETKKLQTLYESYEKEYKKLENNSDSSNEKNLRTESNKLELLLTHLKEFVQLKQKMQEEKQIQESDTKDSKNFEASIKSNESLVYELKAHIKTLRQKRESELLIKKYEDDRVKLESGEACYLCGSKEHPFIKNNLLINSDATSVLIDEKESELKKQEIELQNVNVKLTKAQQKLETSTLELEKLQKQKDFISKIFEKEPIELNDNTKISLEENLQSIETNLTSIVHRREEKERILKLKESVHIDFRAKQKESLECEKQLTQILSLKEQLTKDETKTNKILDSLKEQLTAQYKVYSLVFNSDLYNDKFTILKNRKTSYQKNQSINKEYESQLNKTSIKKKGNETELFSLENELKIDTQSKAEEQLAKDELQVKAIKILNIVDINAYESKVNKSFKELQERENKLNQVVTTKRSKDEELNKQEKTLKAKLVSNEKIFEELKKKVEELFKNNNFETVQAYQKALLSKEQRESLSLICTTIQDSYKEYQTLSLNTSNALKEHKKQEIKIQDIEKINGELDEIRSTSNELQLNIGAVSEILKRDEQDRQKHQEKTVQLEKKKKLFKVWVKLNEMVGSADGNKFAKFAQGITLDQLINLANNHLLVLSNRYELQRSSEQKQLLEIEVIDSFQGDVVRSISTLSGGESFIVSLALALGLSELASQKIAIDSLFLDEGFGTLDEESLETALNALNLLQSSGKMIGVISHVEALKERIPLQIKVIPNGDGTSFIEI